MALVSTDQLAKACNLTPQRIRQLVQEGMPRAAAGRYDLGICMSWYIRYLQGLLEKRLPREEGDADERLKAVRTEILQLQLEQLRGRLMSVEQADRHLDGAFARVRARLSTLPTKTAPLLLGLTTVQDAVVVLERAIQELSEELRRADDVPADNPEEDAA